MSLLPWTIRTHTCTVKKSLIFSFHREAAVAKFINVMNFLQMDIVLEMVHKLDESGRNSVPSRDHVVDSMIFHLYDVVTIEARNVDLDYATKGKLFPPKIMRAK